MKLANAVALGVGLFAAAILTGAVMQRYGVIAGFAVAFVVIQILKVLHGGAQR